MWKRQVLSMEWKREGVMDYDSETAAYRLTWSEGRQLLSDVLLQMNSHNDYHDGRINIRIRIKQKSHYLPFSNLRMKNRIIHFESNNIYTHIIT